MIQISPKWNVNEWNVKEMDGSIPLGAIFADSYNGSTAGSDPVNGGSNPLSAAYRAVAKR